jgi:hypothetical protein
MEQNTENVELSGLLLAGLEEAGKDLVCAELPIVEKHITNVIANLQAQKVHPFKVIVLKWLLGVLTATGNVLSCPIANVATPA